MEQQGQLLEQHKQQKSYMIKIEGDQQRKLQQHDDEIHPNDKSDVLPLIISSHVIIKLKGDFLNRITPLFF